MKLVVEQHARGRSLHVDTDVGWAGLPHERLIDLLAVSHPYNVALARSGSRLRVRAALPPLPDLDPARADWLAGLVETAAERLSEVDGSDGARGTNGTKGTNGTSVERTNLPAAASSAPQEPHDASALESVRQIALSRGWSGRTSAEGSLEVFALGAPRATRLLVEADIGGLRVSAPTSLGLLDQAASARAAMPIALLAQNLRFAFARLRIADRVHLDVVAEAALPPDASEDEVAFALEGVAYAARAAAPVIECIKVESVAREYLAAHHP